MQHSKLSYPLCLSFERQKDGRCSALEERSFMDLLDEVAVIFARVFRNLEVHSLTNAEALIVRDEGNTEHGQDPVQKAVHNLEAAGLAVVSCGEMPLIPGLLPC